MSLGLTTEGVVLLFSDWKPNRLTASIFQIPYAWKVKMIVAGHRMVLMRDLQLFSTPKGLLFPKNSQIMSVSLYWVVR